MKRNLLLMILTAWTLGSWAQTPNLLDSIITTHPIFTDDLLGYTRTKYQMNTNWVEKSSTEDFDLEKGKGARDTLVFNPTGQILFRGRGSYPITSSRPGWKGGTRDSTLYDNLDRKIFEKSYAWVQPSSGEGYNYASSGYKYTYVGESSIVLSKIMGSGQYNVAFGWRGEYSYTYDAQNRVLTETYHKRNAENPNVFDVLDSYKTLTYASTTQKEASLQIYYKRENDAWVNSSKTERVYDANDNLLEESYFNWESEAWVGTSRKTMTYNTSNQVLLSTSYNWSSAENKWQESSKSETIYENNHQTNFSYNWDKTAQQFVYSNKTIREYDALQREILYEYYSYSSGAWKGSSRTTKEYLRNDFQKETLKVTYSWNSTTGTWTEKEKTITTYNEQDKVVTVDLETYNGVDFEPSKRSTYFYSSHASSVNSLQSATIKVIASKGALRFMGATEATRVRIFTTTGTLCFEGWISNPEQTMSLASNLYLVEIGTQSHKVIVP